MRGADMRGRNLFLTGRTVAIIQTDWRTNDHIAQTHRLYSAIKNISLSSIAYIKKPSSIIRTSDLSRARTNSGRQAPRLGT